ncbi:hypothetical protein H9L10_08450 [Phycicoccus endophyticus]|uniref:Uncharacterized protein n=1 Tax=Phycicoccus endophyticus TaxID=1690220 RepID=A0A7G9QYF6_9MICO|nr:hypothetical protein [Phycicoccus endophyticus]NHI19277.1 hypothetical protein [Phycicoccus endophyticus]QNN48381.1 hypothetical protein H9L10_08450 [Phycicoccus endophyticus]GGL41468.1 hypothetical protein GCM10012283_25110 [Phycicoccus endophyticus]
MSAGGGSRRPPGAGSLAAHRRVAELWRAVGLGFTMVWAVLLALVVVYWVRVTFLPSPEDDLPGSLRLLLAPAALAAAVFVLWTLVCGWRLLRRRASGWDAAVVLGSFAIAGAVFAWAPGQLVDGLESAPRTVAVGLVVLGGASVTSGMLAQRAFRRSAVALEPGEEEGYVELVAEDDPTEEYAYPGSDESPAPPPVRDW